MKIRTVSELCDALDSDMKWRKRELTSLRFMLQDVREHQAKPLLRELHAEIVGLVERFNTDVQNAAVTERHRRRAA